MCFAIPGKVVKLKENTVLVDYDGIQREAGIGLLKPKKGDFVLVSTGFIMKVLPEEEAKKILDVWKDALE